MSKETDPGVTDEFQCVDRTPETAEAFVRDAFAGRVSDDRIASWLTELHQRGEQAMDLIPAVRQVRERMLRLRTPDGPVIDTCGTGGDHSGTFNISTAAAFVVAGAGVTVVKHGNRSFSSKTGSADVLEALGVPIDRGVEWAQKCIDEIGFAFCFAPHFHPVMAQFAPIRKRLGFRTLFNMIGPLANPAEARYQMIGVSEQRIQRVMAETLKSLNAGTTRETLIVRGGAGQNTWIDEVSLCGETELIHLNASECHEGRWSPAEFGESRVMVSEIQADNAGESAAIIDRLLNREPGPARCIVVANAAAALWLTDTRQTLSGCVARAEESLDSGRALAVLNALVGE